MDIGESASQQPSDQGHGNYIECLSPILVAGLEPGILCFQREPFHFLLEREMLRASRYGAFVSLLLLPLPDPDTVPAKLVQVLRSNIRTNDILGYFSGNVLGIILLNAPPEATSQVSKRISFESNLVFKTSYRQKKHLPMQSIVFPADASSISEFMELAEKSARVGAEGSLPSPDMN